MMRSKLTAWLVGSWLIASTGSAAFGEEDREGEGFAPPPTSRTNAPGQTHDSKPEPSGRFELGAGYNPDEGIVFSAGVANDRLFGTSHGLSLTARLSRLRQEMIARWEARRLLGQVDMRLDVFDRRRAYAGFSRHGTGAELTLSRALSPSLQGYAGYRLEQVSVDRSLDALALSSTTPIPPSLFASGLVSAARAGLVFDTRDRKLDPRSGTRAEIFVERAHPKLGSDFDFTRVGGSIAYHRPLPGPFTLRLRGAASSVWGRGQPVPLAERLQLDGHSDVRGFPLTSDQGLSLGGNLKATGRAELEFPLISKLGIRGALFYDAGLVRDLDGVAGRVSSLLQHSAGVSLIWHSPIGPLRFDWALPLSGPARKSPRFLFSLGGAF